MTRREPFKSLKSEHLYGRSCTADAVRYGMDITIIDDSLLALWMLPLQYERVCAYMILNVVLGALNQMTEGSVVVSCLTLVIANFTSQTTPRGSSLYLNAHRTARFIP